MRKTHPHYQRPFQELPLDQSTNFEHCRSVDDIQTELQKLSQKLLAVIQTQEKYSLLPSDKNLRKNAEWKEIQRLSTLSYADLKQYPHPVFLLSEISRLLFKLGNTDSLKLALNLSLKIYSFKCQHQESWYISSLYKGIAQIGLHITDLGVKNVLIGLSEQHDFSLIAVDRGLGYWALTSAAILKRNLALASTFAQKWDNALQAGHLQTESVRARMCKWLLYLLSGKKEKCLRTLQELEIDSLGEWNKTFDVLAEWTQAMDTDHCLEESMSFSEPYPLFLGLVWQSPGSTTIDANQDTKNFSWLCTLRRKFCNPITRNTLSIGEIHQYIDIMAQWELPIPLYEFQSTLKNNDTALYQYATMIRYLGDSVVKKILGEHLGHADIMTQNDVIILFMDVRKFSALSENRNPEDIFALLNPVFKIMHEELEQIGGTILEFVGDCIIVVFNMFGNESSHISEILSHTIRCLQRLHTLNAMSYHIDLPEIHIGVGIHKGPVALGNLGGLKRCHLTVLGHTINLASRIESSTKELPGSVAVSAHCFEKRSPEVWQQPFHVNFSCRDAGRRTMRNIREPVHLFTLSPLLRYWVDFVPMGFTACQEQGIVYIDAGNSIQPGIIDHRCAAEDICSSCELLIQRPELLLEHIRNTPISQLEFRFHTSPDLDCATSFYSACELIDREPRQEILHQLARYLHQVNRGRIPQSEQIQYSLYGVYKAHDALVREQHGAAITDIILLEAGMRVVDAAFFLMEQHPYNGTFSNIFRFRPEWFAEEKIWIQTDKARYKEDVKFRGHTYTAKIHGQSQPVTGLWLKHPQSVFFRIWAWDDPNAPGGKGYPFFALDVSDSGKNRFIIAVDPEIGANLKGLGQLLETHEEQKRKLLGKERPVHPIRYPANNSDPWYFGQGHDYTIVDSPAQGTVLTAEEVQHIHENW